MVTISLEELQLNVLRGQDVVRLHRIPEAFNEKGGGRGEIVRPI
jgi:hypothetical protein